jgi:hypothetical protein
MNREELKITEKSIKTELKFYENKPLECLFEYLWNSFDAEANIVELSFQLPPEGIGYVKDVKITDNGKGWDFENDLITNNFMASTKKPKKYSTLPKGQYGRGRYSFIWISKKLYAFSRSKRLELNHNTEIQKENSAYTNPGTQIVFDGISENLSTILSADLLHEKISLEFGWFLEGNENNKILINGKELDVNSRIKESKILTRESFPENLQKDLGENLEVKIILWKEKPSEYSKFYFLDELGVEIFKQNTGFNKKSDGFWHSVYIKSSLFNSIEDIEDNDEENIQSELSFTNKKTKIIKRKVVNYLKEELSKLRKPYLIIQSDYLLEELKEENILPNLPDFGIYDEDSYDDLLKIIYTISPSLFVGKSKSEKKFICATFAGLLSTQDDILIKTILEQLQELSEEEKHDLLDILNRSSLSNMIKTIKEIDHRLDILDKLKVLISEHEKETLEVKHIQKILDENFWLFGEQFRLFSSTEGRLKNVLSKYAEEILEIDDPELQTQPNGEVDLFLTKTESTGDGIQKNIVVELKRASIKLGKKEYDQLESYMEKILEQNLCNGENQYWEFYLIGKDYNDHILNKIDSSKNHGQKSKGLCLNIKDGRVKIYVRKWSDILEVEWGSKMNYLKEKLKIQANKAKETPEDITNNIINNLKSEIV